MRFFIVYAQQQLRSIMSALLFLSILSPEIAGAQQAAEFKTEVPDQDMNIILFRPSGNAILFSILMTKEAELEVEYGRSPLLLDRQLKPGKTEAGKPLFFELSGLLPFTRYYYRVLAKRDGQYLKSEMASFQTSRKTSESFRFVVQADSHLDENTSPEQYAWNLKGMAKDSADLLIDLGDTWMTDKYTPEFEKSAAQYRAQRYYFSLIGKQTPVFLVLGNHDGESGQKTRNGSRELMRDWATAQRKFYFANPEPDRFYSGNNNPDPGNGISADYYSWEWGNALFIVLDPFRFTISNKDPWSRTLGNDQYNWLRRYWKKAMPGTGLYSFIILLADLT